MAKFTIVGTGWCSHFFLRTATACPDCFEVPTLVSRPAEKKEELHRRYGATLVPSSDDAIATNPLCILTSALKLPISAGCRAHSPNVP